MTACVIRSSTALAEVHAVEIVHEFVDVLGRGPHDFLDLSIFVPDQLQRGAQESADAVDRLLSVVARLVKRVDAIAGSLGIPRSARCGW
jgi:hypothetical protein